MSNFDYMTIEPRFIDGEQVGYAVYGHGTYKHSSVLAGQARRSFQDAFDSVEEALQEYPEAEVRGGSTKVRYGTTLAQLSGLPETPPSWFDPMDAGETW